MDLSFIAGATGALVYKGSAVTPTFQNLVNYSEFAALYDQYRVTKVSVDFIYNGGGYGTPLATTPASDAMTAVPMLYVAYDADDSAGSTWDEMRQRASTKCYALKPGKKVTVDFLPMTSVDIAGGAGTTLVRSPVIDMQTLNIPQRGLKWGVAYPQPATGEHFGSVFVQCRLHFKASGVR